MMQNLILVAEYFTKGIFCIIFPLKSNFNFQFFSISDIPFTAGGKFPFDTSELLLLPSMFKDISSAGESRDPSRTPSFCFQTAFIQNCKRCSFSRSPKDWFYTVCTHYCHSLLKADPVTHIFPAAGPPSLDLPPTCHPSVWS